MLTVKEVIRTFYNALSQKLKKIQVQPDLSQNDPTAPDYVKNRTHWEENGGILVDWTVELVDGEAINKSKACDSLVPGKTYKVIFDGEEYICKAEVWENFVFLSCPDGWEIFEYYNDGSLYSQTPGTHTIKILNGNSKIHQLDEKYIPSSIARQSDIEALKNFIPMVDLETGDNYNLSIKNGRIMTWRNMVQVRVDTGLDRSEFYYGERFKPDGLILKALLDNEEWVQVKEFSYNNEPLTTLGYQSMVIHVKNGTQDFTVSIRIRVVSLPQEVLDLLQDFEFETVDTTTYKLIGWKGTLNGEPSTEIVIPDSDQYQILI